MTTRRIAARAYAFSALALAGLYAHPAHADGDYFSPTDDRIRISLGAMHISSATNLQADSSTGTPGSLINGEDQFGLDRSDFEPKFQATVRVTPRQRLSFDYFTLDRRGNAVLGGSTPVIFRDVVLLPTDPLQTQLNLRTFGIAYGYSFWHSERLEIAATLSIHETDISAIVKVQTATRHVIQTEDQAGPVPTIGIDATWVASKRFYFDARIQYLDVHVNQLAGTLGIYELDALYRIRPNVSFAIGYTDIDARLTSNQSSQGGMFDFRAKGPEMFFRVAF